MASNSSQSEIRMANRNSQSQEEVHPTQLEPTQLEPVQEISHDNVIVDDNEDEEDEDAFEPVQALERVLMDETANDGIQMECDFGGVQIKGFFPP